MYLRSLEVQGFKSFPDKTVLQFGSDITAIVGPNGSGKSNISDAISWVLGEQSSKALRGAKMEDVIFGGTQKRAAVGYAEATLVLDNQAGQLRIETPEVAITRRYYRSGESEYFINRQSARLRDINELLMDTGLGKEGYSNIGQGKVDEILALKSTDRREVFEEAAGIVKYRTRKEESEKRLSNMRDNLSRVEDIIAELESQLEPLEKASETARRYLNLRDELRVLECSAFVLRSDRAKERIAEAEQLLTGLKEAIASEEKRADALSEQREKANEGAQKLENEVTAAHDAVLELTRETEAREGELGVLRAEINRMEKDVLALGQEEDVKRARSAALDEEIAKNERDALANRTRIIGLTRELGQKEEALQNAQEEARQAEEKLEAHKSAIIDAMNRLSDVRTSEARLSTMRKELERRGEEADAQKEELELAANRMDEQLAQAAQELEQAKATLQKKPELTARLSAAAKAKRIEDRSNHAYRWVAMAIMLAGFVALIYGIRSLVQKDSSGLYFLLLGLAAIFLFSGLHVFPTAKNNRKAIEKDWLDSIAAMEKALPIGFPVPACYAHPIVLDRMIRVIREGRAQTAPEALAQVKEDLKALTADVQVEQEEHDEVVAIKPMFLLQDYR